MLTFGIEEEVFITEPERPTLRSLYYLARLLAKDRSFYYTHSAHNFTRGKDTRQGVMGGVEYSTAPHDDVEAVVDDFEKRRADLASVTSGLIVPVGHLINNDTPTNTCAIHIHIGGDMDKKRLYGNLVHFLPVLPLFTINSPMAAGEYFGQSYRIGTSIWVGPIKEDWMYRFQDAILSKRQGTVELRVCDPCWDTRRIRYLMRAIKAIAELDEMLDPNVERYNRLRPEIAKNGLLDETADLVDELRNIVDFPMEMLTKTASDELKEIYESEGLLGAYSALDNGYRSGNFQPQKVTAEQRANTASCTFGAVAGFFGYFVPRFPYYLWKGLKER